MSLVLTCQPGRDGDRLVFPYAIENADGAAAAWVMDAATAADAASPSFAAVEGEEAVLGKLMPPLPADRALLMALAPLARRLEPGAVLRSQLAVTLPLVEGSAYLPDLPVRRHSLAELSSIRLVIAAWPASLPGLAALPQEGGLHRLAGPDLRACQHLAEVRFPVRRLTMLRRTDAFVREPAAPAAG